jgi:hypothetical protein
VSTQPESSRRSPDYRRAPLAGQQKGTVVTDLSVIGLGDSMRPGSANRSAVEVALRGAKAAVVSAFDLRELDLPVYVPAASPPRVAEECRLHQRLLQERVGLAADTRRHCPTGAPRSRAERANPNVICFNELDRGNHFAAWKEPDVFTTEIRAAFRSLR